MFQDTLNFDIPHDAKDMKIFEDILKPLKSHISDGDDYKQLFPLLAISHHNKIDLGELLITQYQQSNLSLNEFISRSNCFHKDIIKNYLKMYSKYIYSPIPSSMNQLPSTFKPFNDTIDIILQYLTKINQCINNNLIKSRPFQFDVYFVPPTTSDHVLSLNIKSMIKSGSDIYSLFQDEKAKKMLNCTDSLHQKRVILLIVRQHKDVTDNDILYLLEYKTKYDLTRPEYEYNEILWNVNTINTKQNILDNKQHGMLCVSYHLHSKVSKVYLYFNGLGQRVLNKPDIINKWSLLFKNGGNAGINNAVLNDFKHSMIDSIESDKEFKISEYLFGLKYECKPYHDTRKRIIAFPKCIISNGIAKIKEFNECQQLYYYLTWTSQMQRIDDEFIHYTLNNGGYGDIAIFNGELHGTQNANDILYIVAVLNDRNAPKWKMAAFMTASEIFNEYGINKQDLPIGSRYKHNYFKSEIDENKQKLYDIYQYKDRFISNWHRIELIYSQQYKPEKSNYNDIDLNVAIKQSLDMIFNHNNNGYNLSLISILKIDTRNNKIYCHSLIPIKLSNESKWSAVSLDMNQNGVINGLYIDIMDIINKASLIHPNAIYIYQWLKGIITTTTTTTTQTLQANSWCIIDSLQQQLNESLKRETILLSMLHQKEKELQCLIRTFPVISIIPATPILFNNFQISSPITPQTGFNNNNNNNNNNMSSSPISPLYTFPN